jgi:hypothetical protein
MVVGSEGPLIISYLMVLSKINASHTLLVKVLRLIALTNALMVTHSQNTNAQKTQYSI